MINLFSRESLPVSGNLRVSLRGCGAKSTIRQLEIYLRKNLHVRLSLGDVAFILGREMTYCSKRFCPWTGKTFTEWDRDIRIPRAKKMLLRSDATISVIAKAVGYPNLKAFERNFRVAEGMTPSDFRTANK